MEDILHAQCVSGHRGYNILIDAASLSVQKDEEKDYFKAQYRSKEKGFDDTLLMGYGLNPDYGVEKHTFRDFKGLLLPQELKLSIPDIRQHGLSVDPIYYPMPVLSKALVLPRLSSVSDFADLLLKKQKLGGSPNLLTPYQFLERLKSSIKIIQSVLYERNRYILLNAQKEDYISTLNKVDAINKSDRVVEEYIEMFESMFAEINEEEKEHDEMDQKRIEAEFLDFVMKHDYERSLQV